MLIWGGWFPNHCAHIATTAQGPPSRAHTAAAGPTWDGEVPANALVLDLCQRLEQGTAGVRHLGAAWAGDGSNLTRVVNADVGKGEEHIALTARALRQQEQQQPRTTHCQDAVGAHEQVTLLARMLTILRL
jgi:hypothetical protein